MKTSWDADYIYRSYNSSTWISAKQNEFERVTGVKWDNHYAHGRIVFTPVITTDTKAVFDDEIMDDLRLYAPAPGEAVSFLTAARHLGLDPEDSLKRILGAVKWLWQNDMVTAVVNRNGYWAAYHARRPK
jgi:hypothetical protein